MRKAVRRGLLLLLALGVLAVPAVASGRVADNRYNDDGDRRHDRRSLQVVGLTTDGRLVRFDADTPGRTRSIGRVKGLVGDQSLVGIDYRVQDGKLYGVGNAGGIYTISAADATAAKVSQLTVALTGTSFGSTSTRPRTGCGWSATPARTSGTTSTTPPPPRPRWPARPSPTPP
jgi:hypothetical protein